MTGWRVGYLAAPADFSRMLVEPRHTLSISTSTPSQFAALAALEGPQDAVEAMRLAYARRRAVLMAGLRDLGFTFGHPGGAFYIYTNVSSTGLGAGEFCLRLLREAQVMIFPGTLFGDPDDRYIRISLLQSLPRIETALERIRATLPRLAA